MKPTIYVREALFVAAVLVVPFFFTHALRVTELIAALAVFFTFLHAQMGNRMQEANAAQVKPAVRNGWRILVYQVLKEGLWVVFFAMTHAWAALLGAIVFLCYPFWRKIYCSGRPIKV